MQSADRIGPRLLLLRSKKLVLPELEARAIEPRWRNYRANNQKRLRDTAVNTECGTLGNFGAGMRPEIGARELGAALRISSWICGSLSLLPPFGARVINKWKAQDGELGYGVARERASSLQVINPHI